MSAGCLWLDSNENPVGPGSRAINAAIGALRDAGRYPWHACHAPFDLRSAIAVRFSVAPGNVTLGAGSGDILLNAVRAFASPARALVTAAPSFELPGAMARRIGIPVIAIPVDTAGRLDLHGMAVAARGAGLVFLCNPNNPTATVHAATAIREFVRRVREDSTDTVVAIDEAYHEYVTDPTYASAAAIALADPNVFITRSFSKAHGMAGLRCGYAIGQKETIAMLELHASRCSDNVAALAAAAASLDDLEHLEGECARNAEARAFTLDFFRSLGYEPTDAQGNFIFVDLRRSAREFRDACAERRVTIGRGFPPLDRTHVRISIGTMDEMRRATDVFRHALAT